MELFMREYMEGRYSAKNRFKTSCKREAYPYLEGTVRYRNIQKSQCKRSLKADFLSPISGARDILRLIVDLGMLTYNRKARESDRAIAKIS